MFLCFGVGIAGASIERMQADNEAANAKSFCLALVGCVCLPPLDFVRT